MKRFTDAGRAALDAGNLYAAQSLALTLPDICGSLEDPGPGKTRARYVRWCEQWLQPRYNKFLTSEQIYGLRNSLIHSGSGDVPELSETVFIEDPNVHLIRSGKSLLLSAACFSRDVFDAVDEWDASVTQNAAVEGEKARLLSIRSGDVDLDGGMVVVRYGSEPPEYLRRA